MFSYKIVGSLLSKLAQINNAHCSKGFSSLQRPSIPSKITNILPAYKQCQPECATQLLQPTPLASLCNIEFVRTQRRKATYQPNAIKRIKKHGLEKRLSSRSQREILFRRIIKGRLQLTVFDRFMNEIPEKRTKKRLNLFDKKKGYQSLLPKIEYYRY